MFRFSFCIAAVVLAAGISTSAKAGVIVENWSIDLGGATGSKTDVISGIDRILFNQAINHVMVSKGAGNSDPGAIQVGDTAVVRGAIRASGFEFDEFGGPIPNANLNGVAGAAGAWEMTAIFQANVEFVADVFGVTGFVHTGGPDTFLKLFVDEYSDPLGGDRANTFTGLGFNDGDLVAAFNDTVTGFINPFSFTSLDGSDVAVFNFDKAASAGATTGIIFDAAGNDLVANALSSPEVSPFLNGLKTNEDFFRVLPTVIVDNWSTVAGQFGPSGWASVFAGAVLPTDNNDPLNFFTLGNGAASLSIIPEPASLITWAGLSVFVAGGLIRRRRQKSSV